MRSTLLLFGMGGEKAAPRVRGRLLRQRCSNRIRSRENGPPKVFSLQMVCVWRFAVAGNLIRIRNHFLPGTFVRIAFSDQGRRSGISLTRVDGGGENGNSVQRARAAQLSLALDGLRKMADCAPTITDGDPEAEAATPDFSDYFSTQPGVVFYITHCLIYTLLRVL